MTIKAILVPTDGEATLSAVLETALVVARRFDAHITVLNVSDSALQSAMYTNMSRDLKQKVLDEEKKILVANADEIRKRVEAFAQERSINLSDEPIKEGGITLSFHHELGNKKETLVRWARLFDTTAVMRPAKTKGRLGRALYGNALEAIMLQSGKPVLMVPPDWEPHRTQSAVVAWNHSLEASRALAMTIPWLVQMDKVTVVVPKRMIESGERVVEHLAWHGAKAEVEMLNRRTYSAGKRILNICDKVGAEFLVMGGYSHSRMQEHVLGGVTDHILRHSKVITVMVH
ncbi:MAG: universal stress protein [Arenicellales bacterium]